VTSGKCHGQALLDFAKHGAYRKWLSFLFFFIEFLKSLGRIEPQAFLIVRIFKLEAFNQCSVFWFFLSSDERRYVATSMGFKPAHRNRTR